MLTNQIRQPRNLLVGKVASIKECVVVLGPPPLVVPVVEENQEPQLFSDDVVRDTTYPQFVSMARQKLVPLVAETAKRHAARILSFAERVIKCAIYHVSASLSGEDRPRPPWLAKRRKHLPCKTFQRGLRTLEVYLPLGTGAK
jgi:hypothetical protein